MISRPKAIVSWSTGKDSAFALQTVRLQGEVEIVGLLTTVSSAFDRVSMHGVREELLDRQIDALGLQCYKVRIPSPCPNEVYEREMAQAIQGFRRSGVTHIIFGDLFLQDIRAYREARLAEVGIQGLFPLWMRNTHLLSREMLSAGMRATLTCVDPRQLDASFAGKKFDAALLDLLPESVDPCGENGEFHTFVEAGPMFCKPIPVATGTIVQRDGFVFADVLPA
jgi:uncharacterized protein (TIGR00290 family)